MNIQEMILPRSRAEFEQMSDDMALKFAEVIGDGPNHLDVVLAALQKLHRATVALLDEDGRRRELFALAAYAGGLMAQHPYPLTSHAPARAPSPSPSHKGA